MRISRLRLLLTVASVALGLVVLSLVGVSPSPARAADECPLDTTVQSLQQCVQHAADLGFISNQGVANSLLAMLAAAESSVARGQFAVAANQVQAFIQEVRAQAGIQIEQTHADHMIAHAQAVVLALEEPR
jgi:FIMAH domain-containing protein